jgi:hypothetical protein
VAAILLPQPQHVLGRSCVDGRRRKDEACDIMLVLKPYAEEVKQESKS